MAPAVIYLASEAAGNVSGQVGAGGLAGYNTGTIKGSYASGSVSATERNAGGLVGANRDNEQGTSKIQSSFAAGSVSGGDKAGGLVGENGAKVENSYSVGAVTGTSTGGLIGGLSTSGDGTVSASYWNADTSGITGTGTEGEELKYGDDMGTGKLIVPTSATGIYKDWTTGSVWDFGTASQYPALKADLNGDGTATVGEFGSQRTGAHVPPPTLSASDASATTMKLTIVNHSGAWHYKYTSPTGGTCSGAVSAGTTTARATGLNFGASYTFAAYSDSSCSTLLATASSFTTLTTLSPYLDATDVEATSATITIHNWDITHDGSWHYNGTNISCSGAQTDNAVSIDDLYSGNSYRFTAFSNSACTNEIGAASFSTPEE